MAFRNLSSSETGSDQFEAACVCFFSGLTQQHVQPGKGKKELFIGLLFMHGNTYWNTRKR